MTYQILNLNPFVKAAYNDILIKEENIPPKELVSHNDYEMFKKGYEYGVLGLLFGITSKKKMNIFAMDNKPYTQCVYSNEREEDAVFPSLSFVTKNHVNWRLIGSYKDFQVDRPVLSGMNNGLPIMSDDLVELLINSANKSPEWFGEDYNIALPFRCLNLSKSLLNKNPILNIDPVAISDVTQKIRKLWQKESFLNKDFNLEYTKNNLHEQEIIALENVDLGQFCSKVFRASHSNKTSQNFSLQSTIKLDELIEFFEQVFYLKWNPLEKTIELDDARIMLGLDHNNEMELIPFLSYYPKIGNHKTSEIKLLNDLTIKMNKTLVLNPYNSITTMQNNSNRVFNNSDISFINPFRIYPWLKMVESLSKIYKFPLSEVEIMFRIPEYLNLPNFNILASVPDTYFGTDSGNKTIISDIIFSVSNTNIKNFSKNTDTFTLETNS